MEDWEKRLTPWDIELAIMVESLTGKPCELCDGGDHFFFEADYEKHATEPEYLLALWDAMDGAGICALSKLLVWPLNTCAKWKLRTTYKH